MANQQMKHGASTGTGLARSMCAILALTLAGCSSLGSVGPSGRSIREAGGEVVGETAIQIIPVTDAVTRRVLASQPATSFSSTLGDLPAGGTVVGRGDVLEVTVWEAPPAALFGSSASFGGSGAAGAAAAAAGGLSQDTSMPEMMVDDAGTIRVPFAGRIPVAGRSPAEIERLITSRLAGKAHEPQVTVRLAQNANANVTVVGDIRSNGRIPLTPRGERLLDVIASAGGVSEPVGKTTIQITRGGQVVSMPMNAVIRDPSQNIRLQRDDVVTALFQSFSFTSLGAAGTSAEIDFESTGITLAQALGRIGGLRDDRASARGVFIFRWELPEAVDPATAAIARRSPDGRIPVIYNVDLSEPSTFFVAQGFPIRDKDVLYVSNAPLTDIQKFVGIVSSMAFTVIGLGQAVP